MLVDPWAEVWVDCTYTDPTPVSKALSIPEGEHRIELRNPVDRSEKREVNIRRGSTSTMKIERARK